MTAVQVLRILLKSPRFLCGAMLAAGAVVATENLQPWLLLLVLPVTGMALGILAGKTFGRRNG
ncbi:MULTISPECIES: hypothetical protein [unclassified Pseudofrankia]|uniref:hypothetical protein n=1 Tax=unclassified Pseudofrankia TaxID=2994372 RepID=UPI0008D9CC6D|nr:MULTISPECIES: hypothetical protein [unclassified Pseudofrankia]MDT3444804.1 hypothetical protein [Pseudofrankia sp. BMG5.37]